MKKIYSLNLVILLCALTSLGSYAKTSESTPEASQAIAIFAGGCFWCMQPLYDKTPGVVKTIVGYTGGHVKNPSYEQVSKGDTGHYEAIEVLYNPQKVSYEKLLKIYWHNIDPTDPKGQFCDKGSSYRAAIFYTTKQQQELAEKSKQAIIKSNKFSKVVVPILPAKTFYAAENYHQKYYQKNPVRYKFYRYVCGRDKRLHELWGH